MATCSTCGAYYRLTAYHKDNQNCEDCAYTAPRYIVDAESEEEIQQILNPGAKTAAVRYDEEEE